MSVKTKAVGAAKAGIAVAAPEAAVAEGAVAKTAGAAAAKKAPASTTVKAPPRSGPTPNPASNLNYPGFMTNQDGSPSWWPQQGGAQRAANAGGGFVLGLMAYAVGLAYLRGGAPEVKRLINAKFFNKTSPAGGSS